MSDLYLLRQVTHQIIIADPTAITPTANPIQPLSTLLPATLVDTPKLSPAF